MKNLYSFLLLLLLSGMTVFAQVSINTDNTQPDPSAMLDLKSTNKGLLPPRMTHAQMNLIVSPANGLLIYCTDCSNSGNGALAMFISGTWYMFTPSCIWPLVPTEAVHVPSEIQIIWNWNSVTDATGYKWSTTNNYAGATDMGTATTKTETGLTCNTVYTRYGNALPGDAHSNLWWPGL
jgi:hypothetical protein